MNEPHSPLLFIVICAGLCLIFFGFVGMIISLHTTHTSTESSYFETCENICSDLNGTVAMVRIEPWSSSITHCECILAEDGLGISRESEMCSE